MSQDIAKLIQAATQATLQGDPMAMHRAVQLINSGCYTAGSLAQNDPCSCYAVGSFEWFACQIQGAGRCQPSATNTPQPTVTPVPGLRLPINNGRLSNCEFADRTGTSGLHSRDINPPGMAQSQTVYATVKGQVMIVDTTGNNAGLGNFVAIRVNVADLPPHLNKWGSGYLYIGFAHLASVQVLPNDIVMPETIIGQSGATGLVSALPHLDVSVFYVPLTGPTNLSPSPQAVGINSESGEGPQYYFQNFYTIFKSPDRFGPTREVDPLELWPELKIGTRCP